MKARWANGDAFAVAAADGGDNHDDDDDDDDDDENKDDGDEPCVQIALHEVNNIRTPWPVIPGSSKKQPHGHQQVLLQHPLHPPTQC